MRSNHPIETVRDVQVELKALRLHGMASAWGDLMEQGGGASIEPSRWLIEHLLQAEDVDRHMRSIAHQMKAANAQSASPREAGSRGCPQKSVRQWACVTHNPCNTGAHVVGVPILENAVFMGLLLL